MIDFKVLAQPSAIQTGDTRDNVYYPQIVNLSPLNTRGLIQAMMNMGSTAFSMGEYLGVASDLGGAIAQMMISGHKINLEGLGTFTPKIETTQKNVKEASAVNSSNFSCTVVFTPADEFVAVLRTAIWNRVQSVDPGQASANAFTVAISSPAGNTLKLVASKAGALANFPAAGESITIDGVAPSASNIRYDVASGAIYIYNVAAGKHTVAITVGTSRGFEAYDNTWKNVPVADAAALIPVSVYNGDDEEDVLRVSVNNGATWLEGQESKNISVGEGAEFPIKIKATSTTLVNYKIEFRHSEDDEVSGCYYQAPGGGWTAVPANGIITPAQGCSSTAVREWKFKANVASQLSIKYDQQLEP